MEICANESFGEFSFEEKLTYKNSIEASQMEYWSYQQKEKRVNLVQNFTNQQHSKEDFIWHSKGKREQQHWKFIYSLEYFHMCFVSFVDCILSVAHAMPVSWEKAIRKIGKQHHQIA